MYVPWVLCLYGPNHYEFSGGKRNVFFLHKEILSTRNTMKWEIFQAVFEISMETGAQRPCVLVY